mgnify:CR=1 FL=1
MAYFLHPLLARHDLRDGIAQLVVALGLHGGFQYGRQYALLGTAHGIHRLRRDTGFPGYGFQRHVGVALFLHELHGGRDDTRLRHICLFLSAGRMVGARLLHGFLDAVCGFSGHVEFLNIE